MLNCKNLFAMGAALTLAAALLAVPASALEYEFSGAAPGETFYGITSTDTNYIANSAQITVGMDGTISSGVTGNVSSSPLSVLDLPIGEYPDAWGMATDVAIAQNTIFPNELGPTTQNSAIYRPVFVPTIQSGAFPTGVNYLPAAVIGSAITPYGVVANGQSMAYAASFAMGVPTSTVPMPGITTGGAIGRLSIPAIGLNQYVYEGTSTKNMQKGLAHFDCTSGYLGNIALAGHNRGNYAHFAKLKDLKYGDTLTYTTSYGTATYAVSSISYCSTTDTSGLLQDGTNKITMYTCKAGDPNVKLCVVATMVGAIS